MVKVVTLQYFNGCPSWQTTQERLRQLHSEVDFSLELQEIESDEQAQAVGFRGSPTVLVDGVDPFAPPGTPVGMACRVYQTPAGLAGSPTVEQLREVLIA